MNVHSSIIYNSKRLETIQMSINCAWTMEYYSALKRNKLLKLAINKDNTQKHYTK